MENPIIEVNKKILYDFNVKGQKFTLTYDEAIQLKKMIEEKTNQVSNYNNLQRLDNSSIMSKYFTLGSDAKRTYNNLSLNDIARNYKSPPIPSTFRQVFESECDPRSPYQSVFVYYKDPLDSWGYQIKSKDGHNSSFSTVGKISDTDSVIGEFYSKIPKNQSFVKKGLLGMSKRVTEGRRLKACIDILSYTGHLNKEHSLEKNVVHYNKINKVESSILDNK